MSYSQIDSTVSERVDKYNLSLFTHIDGVENSDCRSIYISSKRGECCQIWIDKPESNKVCVHAADVETHQDEALSQNWCVPISELGVALEDAISCVQKWFER